MKKELILKADVVDDGEDYIFYIDRNNPQICSLLNMNEYNITFLTEVISGQPCIISVSEVD